MPSGPLSAAQASKLETQYGEKLAREIVQGTVGTAGHHVYRNAYGKGNRRIQDVYILSHWNISRVTRVRYKGEWKTLGGAVDAERGQRIQGIDAEIWIKVYTGTMDQTLKDICNVLDATISRAALTEEREIIVTLREPQHHRPNAEAFNKALHKNAPTQDMLKVLCFPVLLAYDSEVLAGGFLADYVANLKTEVTQHYKTLLSTLPSKIQQVRVVVFLVPMESIRQLVQKFDSLCRAAS